MKKRINVAKDIEKLIKRPKVYARTIGETLVVKDLMDFNSEIIEKYQKKYAEDFQKHLQAAMEKQGFELIELGSSKKRVYERQNDVSMDLNEVDPVQIIAYFENIA